MYDMKCPLAERVARWYECTVHPWVLFTVANGYRLQFAVKPPTFNAVLSSVANVCADPGRGDCDIIKQTRNQMGSGQGNASRVLFPILSCSKEGGLVSPANPGPPSIELTF